MLKSEMLKRKQVHKKASDVWSLFSSSWCQISFLLGFFCRNSKDFSFLHAASARNLFACQKSRVQWFSPGNWPLLAAHLGQSCTAADQRLKV